MALDLLSWACILLGSFFTIVGAFGLVRMPEVFTRMHAASVTDTLGVGFLILGMGLQAGLSLVTLKLVFLLALFFFTGPVITHALAQACLHENIRPLLSEDRRGRDRSQARKRGGREAAIETIINAALLTLLAVVTVAIVFQRSLFGVVVLTTIYSFLMASVLIVLDAVDVAMTEASVGAGISTVILLATLHLIKTTEMRSARTHLPALLLAVGTGAVLVWGTLALPPFGTADMVINKHVVPRYLARHDQGDQRSERRDLRPGRLSRLRHARRDDGDLHRRDRRDAAAARRAPARAKG